MSGLSLLRRTFDPGLQDRLAGQAFQGGGSRCLPHMVGLDCAMGQQRVGPLVEGLADQKLELAGFAASAGQTRAVVPFDEQAGSAKFLAQAQHGLQPGWPMAEGDAWKFF